MLDLVGNKLMIVLYALEKDQVQKIRMFAVSVVVMFVKLVVVVLLMVEKFVTNVM